MLPFLFQLMESTSNKNPFVLLVSLWFLRPLVYCQLSYNFYDETCPCLTNVVRTTIWSTMFHDPKIAASLLRLHFHDCFANGCDASVLLDDTSNFKGEKGAKPNQNSIRGFEVIDSIKFALEIECPCIVSCSDILALAAREAVYLSHGPFWNVLLGRRDGTTASEKEANDLPSPFDSLETIIAKFNSWGLDIKDVAVLSGAHTIGFAHCSTFKQRLFNYNGTGQPDPTLDPSLLKTLQILCADQSGSGTILAPLDPITTVIFDNRYYTNLLNKFGLLQTDEALLGDETTASLVKSYSQFPDLFFKDFATSMEKMGLIGVLTGQQGEIRTNCRRVN